MRRFTHNEKLKAVRSHLEEGFNLTWVGQAQGISKASLVLRRKNATYWPEKSGGWAVSWFRFFPHRHNSRITGCNVWP